MKNKATLVMWSIFGAVIKGRIVETEPVRINKELMNRLRKYISMKTEGRMYGEIGTTIEKALKEYLDRVEPKI